MELRIHVLKGLKIKCFGQSQGLVPPCLQVPASRVVNYRGESTLRVHGCCFQACTDTLAPKTVLLDLGRSDGVGLFNPWTWILPGAGLLNISILSLLLWEYRCQRSHCSLWGRRGSFSVQSLPPLALVVE